MRAKTMLNVLAAVSVSVFALTPLSFLPRKSLIFVLAFLLWILIATRLDNSFLKTAIKFGSFLILFLVMDVILSLVNNDPRYAELFFRHKIFVYTWGLFFAYYDRHVEESKNVIFTTLVVFIVSSVFTIVGNLKYPNASRYLATGGSRLDIEFMKVLYRRFGIGGYDFIYGSVFLLMPIASFLNCRQHRTFLIFSMISLIVSIIYGAYTIAIILAFVSLILGGIRHKNKNTKSVFVVLLLSLIAIFAFRVPLLKLLLQISERLNIDSVAKHVSQLLDNSYFSSTGNRAWLFQNGLMNILDEPFFGTFWRTGDLRSSGHSALLNYFEMYGVFGVAYVAYFIMVFKTLFSGINNESIKKRIVIYFFMVAAVLTLNTFDTSPIMGIVIFFIGPMIFKISDYGTTNLKRSPPRHKKMVSTV